MNDYSICHILTSWYEETIPAENPKDPPAKSRIPLAALDHHFLWWKDVTGELSDTLLDSPNLVVIEAVLPLDQLDQLEADPNLVILWSDRQ